MVYKVSELEEFVINRILEEMEKKGLSKRWVGKKVGKSHGWVTYKLKKKRRLTLKDIEDFSKALEINPTDLFPTPKGSIDNILKMSVEDFLRTANKVEEEK